MQASFGPTPQTIVDVQTLGYEGWIQDQFGKPLGQDLLARYQDHLAAGGVNKRLGHMVQFWEHALYGDDQLRWRSVLALSQIFVVSYQDPELVPLSQAGTVFLTYLRDEALGNYCDLVRKVTYSPVMGMYLTYHGNRKTDPVKGFVPDENYAREILQLFTIGTEELNLDGTSKGVETYDSSDISELAKVFTGLNSEGVLFARGARDPESNKPMIGFDYQHEPGTKTFLGTTLNNGTDTIADVNEALDHILAHPNVAPFVAKQMIQKFVTSNPSPAYVQRVAQAFNAGQYQFSDGSTAGTGRRCDMKATLAAVLLDQEARSPTFYQRDDYGKVRSTLLRQAQFLRLFTVPRQISTTGILPDIGALGFDNSKNNMPFMFGPSVFNFYRSTYVPAGTEIARRGMVAPEMQIFTADNILNITDWTQGKFVGNFTGGNSVLIKDNDYLAQLARTPDQLVDELDTLMTYGTLAPEVRQHMIDMLSEIESSRSPSQVSDNGLSQRLSIAASMFMTTPEYIVQR
ncbi:DUF1800 domain-containing protein [Parvularcula lutaonensis]|uniref:DUF1800 family protein n=1 Tax=Parvularcula lutaonensis TaxID=491923 RepID=A0ABV7MBF9_9PROT|nr:DUF1800 family protein [Parvularcula lutaonensis]